MKELVVRSLIGLRKSRSIQMMLRNLCSLTSNQPIESANVHEGQVCSLDQIIRDFPNRNIFGNIEKLKLSVTNLDNNNAFQYLDLLQEIVRFENDSLYLTKDLSATILNHILNNNISNSQYNEKRLAQIFATSIAYRCEQVIFQNYDLFETLKPRSVDTFANLCQIIIDRKSVGDLPESIDKSYLLDMMAHLLAIHPKCSYLCPQYIDILSQLDVVNPVVLNSAQNIIDTLQYFSLASNKKKITKIPLSSRIRGECSECRSRLHRLDSAKDSTKLKMLEEYFQSKIISQNEHCPEDFEKKMKQLKLQPQMPTLVVDFANFAKKINNLRLILDNYILQHPNHRILFVIRNYHWNMSKIFVDTHGVQLINIGNLQNDDIYVNYICLMLKNERNRFLTDDNMKDIVDNLKLRPELREIFKEYYVSMNLKLITRTKENKLHIYTNLPAYRSISLSKSKKHIHIEIQEGSNLQKANSIWLCGEID
ncbi:MAG: hypothetical protein MHMPM18_002256 [Marteilia pararefringens]